jgi:hypothetical protein
MVLIQSLNNLSEAIPLLVQMIRCTERLKGIFYKKKDNKIIITNFYMRYSIHKTKMDMNFHKLQINVLIRRRMENTMQG